MVDVIARRQSQRKANIYRVEKLIQRARAMKGQIHFKNLVLGLMDTLNVSERVAKEYIKVALYRLKITKEIFR